MAYEDSISIEVSHGDVSRIPTAKKAWINSIQMTNALVPWCPHFDRSPTGLRVHLQRAILNVHHWDFPNGLGIIWIGWGKVFFSQAIGISDALFSDIFRRSHEEIRCLRDCRTIKAGSGRGWRGGLRRLIFFWNQQLRTSAVYFSPPATWGSLDLNKGATTSSPSSSSWTLARAPDAVGCAWTQTLHRELRMQWAAPGLELYISRDPNSIWWAPDAVGHAWTRTHARECQIDCQTECQNICQTECQTECQTDRMSE